MSGSDPETLLPPYLPSSLGDRGPCSQPDLHPGVHPSRTLGGVIHCCLGWDLGARPPTQGGERRGAERTATGRTRPASLPVCNDSAAPRPRSGNKDHVQISPGPSPVGARDFIPESRRSDSPPFIRG